MWFATFIVFIIGVYFTFLATKDRIITSPKQLVENLKKYRISKIIKRVTQSYSQKKHC
jgi:predicted PurR-regulated permease PerM